MLFFCGESIVFSLIYCMLLLDSLIRFAFERTFHLARAIKDLEKALTPHTLSFFPVPCPKSRLRDGGAKGQERGMAV